MGKQLLFLVFLFCTLIIQGTHADMCEYDTYIKDGVCTVPDAGYYADNCSMYTELNYIKSTGTQWINTNYIPTANTSIHFGIYMDVNSKSVIVGHDANGNDSSDYRIFNANGEIFWDYNESRLTGGTFTTGKYYDIEAGNNYVIQDGNRVLSGTRQNKSSSFPIGIFASRSGTTAKGRIYYLEIYEGSNLVRDFIPVRRNSDNTIGMYDRVQGVFYKNNGTGAFSAGGTKSYFITDCASQNLCPAGSYCVNGTRTSCPSGTYSNDGATQCTQILPGYYGANCAGDITSGYTQTEYFISTGTQWINTNYIPTVNTAIKFGINMSEKAPSIIVGHNAEMDDDADYRIFNADGEIFWDYNTSRLNGGQLTPGTYYDMEIGNNYVKQNGIQVLSGPKQTQGSAYPIGIFSSKANIITSQGRIYYLQIYENGQLVRNFIPAIRNDDNSVGMFETIENTFYLGNGTGGHTSCSEQILCEPGYYCENGKRYTCKGAPDNAIYVNRGETNPECAWECDGDNGYGKTSANNCAELCGAGIRYLRTSNGIKVPLFANKNVSPSIYVERNGVLCYADLVQGNASSTLNMEFQGSTYHIPR